MKLSYFSVLVVASLFCQNLVAQPMNGPSGGPPQEAISACSSKSQNSSCSFNAPRGAISGVCLSVNNGSLACVPSEMMNRQRQNEQGNSTSDFRGQESRSSFGNQQNFQQESRARTSTNIAAKTRSGKSLKSLIPDTNQGSCFSNNQAISCPKVGEEFYGQDGNFFGATPQYRDNKDGTVSDLVTNLTWQKAHNSQRLGYYSAKQTCENLTLGNRSDWRLPTIKELFSLADFRGAVGGKYFLDSKYFDLELPDSSILQGDRYSTHETKMMGQTWSSTIYTGKHFGREGVEAAFFFNFLDGHIKQAPTNSRMSLFYRCVAGKKWGENSFVDNKNGTVTDNFSLLQWQKSDDGVARNWQQALQYCQDLKLAGFDDWRLPNVKELQSIVDYSKWSPALNTNYFNISDKKAWFWSSTTHGDSLQMANYVCFGPCTSKDGVDTHGAGAQRSDPKTGSGAGMSLGGQEDEVRVKNYVRCVR